MFFGVDAVFRCDDEAKVHNHNAQFLREATNKPSMLRSNLRASSVDPKYLNLNISTVTLYSRTFLPMGYGLLRMGNRVTVWPML